MTDLLAFAWYWSCAGAFVLGYVVAKWIAADRIAFLTRDNERLRRERDETPEAEPVEDYDEESAPWHDDPNWWRQDR